MVVHTEELVLCNWKKSTFNLEHSTKWPDTPTNESFPFFLRTKTNGTERYSASYSTTLNWNYHWHGRAKHQLEYFLNAVDEVN